LVTIIAGNDYTLDIIVSVILFAILGFGIYWTAKNKKPTLNLIFKCAFFAM